VSVSRPIAYCTTRNALIDFLHHGETPAQAFQRLAEHSTTLTVMSFDAAWSRHEQAFKTDPTEISSATFQEMLCVLPPRQWRHDSQGESFKMMEHLTGNITDIYVRLADRFFTFNDHVRTPHAECCQRVRDSKAFYATPLNAEYPDHSGEEVDPITVSPSGR
jgi:hypothetical protein